MGKVIFNPSGDNRYNLPDKGAKDAFIVKLSSENQVLNVKRFGNKTDEEITDLLFIARYKRIPFIYANQFQRSQRIRHYLQYYQPNSVRNKHIPVRSNRIGQ